MTIHVLPPFSTVPGSVVKALPIDVSLSTYVADGVVATEDSAPNTGRYNLTLDDADGMVWRVFLGATQPDNWNDYELEINLADITNILLTSDSFDDSAIAKINQHRSR